MITSKTTTFAHRFALNAEQALKSGSTWVILVAATLGGLYLLLPEASQNGIVDAVPFLHGQGAIVTVLVGYLVARFKPSNAVSSQTKAMVEEITRLRLNEFLRDHNLPLVPEPEAPVQLPPVSANVVAQNDAMTEALVRVAVQQKAAKAAAAAPAPAPAPTPAPAPAAPMTSDQLLSALADLVMQRAGGSGYPLDFDDGGAKPGS